MTMATTHQRSRHRSTRTIARPAIETRAITSQAIAAWLALCIITAVLLGPLRHSAPGPQSFDENGLRVFIDRFGPSAPLLWMMHLVASAAAAVHLGLLTLGLGARCIGAVNVVRLLDRISPTIIRRLLTPLTVASLTASMSLSTMPGASASTPSPPPPAVMVVAAPAVGAPAVGAPVVSTSAASTPVASASPTTRLAPATIEVDSTVIPPDTPTIGGTVVVARGDSLWSIAEDALRTHLGRVPAEHETSRYWRALIAANRDRLRDHDNPNLIFAGQQLVLP